MGKRTEVGSRAVKVGRYIIDTGQTVREAAEHFGVSKSTIHKDIVERLPKINRSIANQAKEVLEKNLNERAVRGGEGRRKI